ncbi:hypothetical protein GCM10009566_71670 [Streptomyces murinus]|uniref:Uncharacterized protein n=1 Tax=Streptomyces murinus TaxID=33900 RepID=A0A7W3NTG0_STRMR|nr:hypothetical protein [Streptomyces murinus]
MIWCPRCDQGWVTPARARGQSETFRLCHECDTVWVDREPDANPPFLILEEYAARFGLDGLWSNIEVLERKPGA